MLLWRVCAREGRDVKFHQRPECLGWELWNSFFLLNYLKDKFPFSWYVSSFWGHFPNSKSPMTQRIYKWQKRGFEMKFRWIVEGGEGCGSPTLAKPGTIAQVSTFPRSHIEEVVSLELPPLKPKEGRFPWATSDWVTTCLLIPLERGFTIQR